MALKLPKQFHPDFSRPGVKPTGSVEVDWSNPLARGLKVCLLGSSQRATNLANQSSKLTINGNVTHKALDGFVFGDTVSDYISDASTDYAQTGKFSAFLVVKAEYSSGSLPAFIARGDSSAGEWMFRHNNSGAVRFYANGGTWNTTSANLLSYGIKQTVGFTADTGSGLSVYVNGAVANTAGGSFLNTSTKPLTVGAADGDSNRPYAGSMNLIIIYDRLLSDQEHAELNRDPYQILKPAQPRMLFLPAGGATGYTLNADVNANTLGGDSVSLLANRSLAADVNSLALGADGVVMSSGITLVADVNTLTVGGDDVALTANRLIGADVNALTLGGDGVDLTRGWTFSADVNSLTLGGDDVTLTYTSGATYTLTADAGAYTVSSDSVDLLANRLLTADARAYILSADSVTLSVGVVDTEDCYVWLQSQITDVAYTVSAINVNNYLVSDVDDTAQYLTSAFGAEVTYLESCICHCA